MFMLNICHRLLLLLLLLCTRVWVRTLFLQHLLLLLMSFYFYTKNMDMSGVRQGTTLFKTHLWWNCWSFSWMFENGLFVYLMWLRFRSYLQRQIVFKIDDCTLLTFTMCCRETFFPYVVGENSPVCLKRTFYTTYTEGENSPMTLT